MIIAQSVVSRELVYTMRQQKMAAVYLMFVIPPSLIMRLEWGRKKARRFSARIQFFAEIQAETWTVSPPISHPTATTALALLPMQSLPGLETSEA